MFDFRGEEIIKNHSVRNIKLFAQALIFLGECKLADFVYMGRFLPAEKNMNK